MSPGEIWRRIHFLLNRSRLERDLDDEMAAHRAMKQGGEPRFGSPLKLREDSRDVWGWGWWDHLVQDVTFGSRMLRKFITVTAPICANQLPSIVEGSYTLRSASVILRREASIDGRRPASRLKTTMSTAPVT